MKIAIHDSKRDGFYSNKWIAYCKNNNIDYKLVNACDTDIVEQVKDCTSFLWHHNHTDYKEVLFAKQLLYSLQERGLKVYPDFHTGWHFDDKVGQKYLLEAIEAPLVPTYIFYDKQTALNWVKVTSFPKVFKLRGGSGSNNVMLAETKSDAIKLINTSFGKGFPQFNAVGRLKERYRNFKLGRDTIFGLIKGLYRIFATPEFAKMKGNERICLFPGLYADNSFDTRVVVIGGKKAMAERRFTRKDDFRASGSGEFSYDDINEDAIKVAFNVAKRLKLQSCGFDFVLDENAKPLIVEISYGFGTDGIGNASGYWDDNIKWHEEALTIEEWIIQSLIDNQLPII